MSKFVPRWSYWNAAEDAGPEARTAKQQTCKTSKSTSAGFAGSLEQQSEVSKGLCNGVRTGSTAERRSRHDAEQSRFESMTLAEFATAGMVVRVRSRILGRDVLFVSDDVPDHRIGDENLPVYRAAELKKLATLRPAAATLRSLNEVKTVFRAEGALIEEIRHER